MAENDATRDDYEDKYLGGGEDDLTERLADIDDETAEARAQALLKDSTTMTLMKKTVPFLALGVSTLTKKTNNSPIL